MRPLTRSPEASDAAASAAHTPHTRLCAPLKRRRRHSASRSTCAAASNVERALLATRRRHGVQVQEQLWRRALHARADGLDATDHLLCEGAVESARECVTEFSGGATPHRSGVAQS
jgi:hypothetical protein